MAVGEDEHANRKIVLRGRIFERAGVALHRRARIDHERAAIAAIDDVGVRPLQRHRRRVWRPDERYHAFSIVAGIAKSPPASFGMIVSTGFRRAKSRTAATSSNAARRSRCLIVG